MIKVLVFDLDDTLYEELTYVKSGFLAVSSWLERNLGIDNSKALAFLSNALAQGRGRIFDDLLLHFQCFTKKNVTKCIQIYRSHTPMIKLDLAAERCLERFNEYPLYIVTDGNKIVQHNKLLALGLYKRVRRCFITHRFGVKHAKPSPYCFERINRLEAVSPAEVVYIGDNPAKDFVGIKAKGYLTVRIMQGNHRLVEKEEDYEAHARIDSLDELQPEFLDRLSDTVRGSRVEPAQKG
ncbi:HAD family hydrolase [uncultured Paenibacillus sp.]|uniref:HAD family hydrolase n=1 Tax=uncultured Paenibacillus sp. TaxID=227322 RepID=UPI0028D8A20B|nr:HAD family hydrolase [uncultured Paenibacillus sp.]